MSYSHLPIDDILKDKLEFTTKAQEIASYINRVRGDIPYAISINGSWGAGKSTLLNFIEYYIDEKKCDVIRFNPWMITNKEDLIYLLFEEIYYCIDKGYTKAKTKFIDYSKKFITPLSKVATYFGATSNGFSHHEASATSEATATAIGILSNDFFNKPLSKQKKELDEELTVMFKENDRKIVVVIDELDRLFPDEIITIFQLIKSTLSLPGLLFVVAMDPTVIKDSLKNVGITNSTIYLQKIFQRNYNIGAKFQLRTLTNKLLLPQIINDDKESMKSLVELLDTFIHLNEDKFIQLIDDQMSDRSLLADRQKNVRDSYFKLYSVLRDEFENPRTFINFIDYLLDRWDDFYVELKTKVELNQLNLQSAFLIFVTFFKYSEYLHLANEWSDAKSNPVLVARVGGHLNTTIQWLKKETADGGKTVQFRNDEGKKEAVFILQKYPDAKIAKK